MSTTKTIRFRTYPFRWVILATITGLAACGEGSRAGEQLPVAVQSGTATRQQSASARPGRADRVPVPRNLRNVIVNETWLPDDVVRELELRYRVRFSDGRYWYDTISGAWGLEGGPCVGIGVPGLNIAGPIRPNSSNGNTGIFINGRELHLHEALGIQTALGIPPQPGRYRWDAYGNVGYEGGPVLFNVQQVLAARSASQGGAWSHHSAYGPTSSGSTVGGDGQGFFYYQDGKTSYTSGN